MKWLQKKLKEYSKLKGYQKPEKHPNVLKLDSNENFAIDPAFSSELIEKAKQLSDVREYPLGRAEKLVETISGYIKVPVKMIGIGNGSDQIIDLLLANFVSDDTRVLTTDPTFGFFEERCKLYSIPTIKIPFSKNMTLDLREFLSKGRKSDILYLDSPNNPTGFQFAKKDLQKLISEFEGVVIIDEAYVEFADYSAVQLAKRKDNLIVIRTLSKAFGLAGLRLGYFVANKELVDVFSRVIQYPYPLNSIAIEAGILALAKSRHILDVANLVKKERGKVIQKLRKTRAFEVFDSNANFVLFDVKGGYRRFYTALLEQGILIRIIGKIGKHDGCLRVTIGTPQMNSKFLLAVRDLLR